MKYFLAIALLTLSAIAEPVPLPRTQRLPKAVAAVATGGPAMPVVVPPPVRTTYYAVTAVDIAGLESDYSNEVSSTNRGVSLYWTPSVSPNITGYNLYSGTNSRVYHTPLWVGLFTNWPTPTPPVVVTFTCGPFTLSQTSPAASLFLMKCTSNGLVQTSSNLLMAWQTVTNLGKFYPMHVQLTL
jgi:hypothetical protein